MKTNTATNHTSVEASATMGQCPNKCQPRRRHCDVKQALDGSAAGGQQAAGIANAVDGFLWFDGEVTVTHPKRHS